MHRTFMRAASLIVSAFLLATLTCFVQAQSGVTTLTGSFPDGATYLIEVPANWNGTLLLYSHGYVVPGAANPAHDVGDPLTRFFLLTNGFALAGSSYATTGWAVDQAFVDQIAVLNTFSSLVGSPARTIAWGHSLGGIITAGLVQKFPNRFAGALPMCGVVAGGVGTWNQALDSAFAFANLLAPGSGLQVVNITNPVGNLGLAETILAGAQASPQGQARLALVAALTDEPGWFDPASPPPPPTDFAAQELNQFLWMQQVTFPFAFAFRAELEARARGNPSWNTGVNYKAQLKKSVDYAEVVALYEQAGLDLNADLEALQEAARISANPPSVAYLSRNIIFNGQLSIPVLTIHTVGDGLVVVEDEQAYAMVVREADDSSLLRQAFVARAGHCTFTPAETIAALSGLIRRLDTGKWQGINPNDLNQAAAALGSTFNIAPPSYLNFKPAPFLRPFDAFTH